MKTYSLFPLGLEKWDTIFQSGNFDQTGKVREFYPKYWKNQEVLTLENGIKRQGNLAVRKEKTMEIGCHTLNKINLKNTGKVREVRQSEKWEPCTLKGKSFMILSLLTTCIRISTIYNLIVRLLVNILSLLVFELLEKSILLMSLILQCGICNTYNK